MRRSVLLALSAALCSGILAGCPFTAAQTKILYYANHGFEASRLYKMDLDGSHRTCLWEGSDPIWSVSATSDGSRILIEVNHNIEQHSLILLDSDGVASPVVEYGMCIDRPTLTADGTRVVFGQVEDPHGYVLSFPSLDVPGEALFYDTQWVSYQQVVSPVGPQIAFMGRGSDSDDIFVISTDTPALVNITNNPAYDYGPVYSPDGSQIAFMTDRDGNHEVYIMNADGTHPTNLSNSPDCESTPCFSPDGKKVSYLSTADGEVYSLYVVNTEGTGRRNLVDRKLGWCAPAWCADSRRLAFESGQDIWIANVLDGATRNLTRSPDYEHSPIWSPDGRRIVFHTQDSRGKPDRIRSMLANGANLKDLTDEEGGMFGQFIETR